MSKRLLQAVLLVVGLISVITGAMGVLSGVMDKYYGLGENIGPGAIILDSNLRYFSGVWFGLGLIILWMLPSIEKQKLLLRLIAIMVFLGGVGRIFSMVHLGRPSFPYIIFTAMELSFPLLIIWQNTLVRARPAD